LSQALHVVQISTLSHVVNCHSYDVDRLASYPGSFPLTGAREEKSLVTLQVGQLQSDCGTESRGCVTV